MKTIREIAEMHYQQETHNEADENYKQARIKALEKLLTEQLNIAFVSVPLVRQAFADYYKSEGCSCCRDIDNHKKAETELAELLKPDKYEDESGWNWYKYETNAR